MITPLLLLATITFTPARPTVGDPITIQFPAPVAVQPSKEYEIVARRGERLVIVRTFEPKPFALHTSAGDVVIPVHSVLKQGDRLEPAPLKPPRREPYPRAPFTAIAVAALAAIASWTGVFLLARRRRAQAEPEIAVDPAGALRRAGDWAGLADALRLFLAATDPRLGLELTTRELLARCDDATVAEVLRQGDLQKFSPWGAAPGDFEDLARRARELIPKPAAPEERAA